VTESPVVKKLFNIPITITAQELLECSPQVRQAYMKEIRGIKTQYEDIEEIMVNIMAEDEPEFYQNEEEEQVEKKSKTCAYATCMVDGISFSAIVDTGAGMNIMSEAAMHKLEYQIDTPTRKKVVTANGDLVLPLGIIKNVVVQFGRMTITSNFTIIAGGQYALLLGNDWLYAADARIYPRKETMKIRSHGKSETIPLNFDKGTPIKKEIQDEESKSEYSSEEEAFLIHASWAST